MKLAVICVLLLLPSTVTFAQSSQAVTNSAAVPSPKQYPFSQIMRGLKDGSANPSLSASSPMFTLNPMAAVVDPHVPASFVPPSNVPLTPTGAGAVDASRHIIHELNPAVVSSDGRVVYTYGVGLPEVICAPLRVCALELQPGEVITGKPQIGDSARWLVTPTASGTGDFKTPVLVIKPTEAGLDTTMIVTTDRRTYYVRLVSKPHEFVAQTAFHYPDDVNVQWQMFLAAQRKERAQQLARQRIAYTSHRGIAGMYFDYKILQKHHSFRRAPALKPVRVMDDGTKTYIEMPPAVSHRDLPVLVVVGPDGRDQMVNYRVKGNMYIVDRLFNKAALLLGTGRHQIYFWIVREKPVNGSPAKG